MTKPTLAKRGKRASGAQVTPIRRVAVLGAGTMGAQIAGILANQGVPCDLLDLADEQAQDPAGRNRIAEQGKQRLLKLTPAPVYGSDVLKLITTGNFHDDLHRLREADWVIEAVVERLDVKRAIWAQAAQHLRPDAIASSNTSGIPIASIAEALPPTLRRRFLGTHFFNPPRYLRLLEVIPTTETEPSVVRAISHFAEYTLGKGVIIAKDVPNFVTNRIGCYGFLVTLRAMEEFGLGFDDVDAITGPVIGRPNSATFRTLDLVGIDIFVQVCDNTRGFVQEAWEQACYDVPAYIREMLKRGWMGDKGGQGFYKRVRDAGAMQVLVLDPKTMDYRPRRRMQAPSLEAARKVEDLGQRLRMLVGADDPAGRFAWRVLSQTLVYSARKVGEVADDIASIDRGMSWGFGWEMGPFEMWDALGVAETVKRMEADGLSVPKWVTDLAKKGKTFFRQEKERTVQATARGRYAAVPEGERTISLRRLREAGKRVSGNPGASLYDLGDGVALLDFHSPNQAIGREFLEMLEEALQRVPREFRGLVIGSHVLPNFCVGANVALILGPAEQGQWQVIAEIVRRFQYGMLALKRLPAPVVVAPYGATVGCGAEIALAADRIVAHAETYLGLVEVGAGLIPAGGGCKEMLARALAALPGGPTGAPPEAMRSAVGRVFTTIAQGKTSGSAHEARTLGFLRPEDRIVANQDHLLYEAKQAALELAGKGYRPPAPLRLPVLGPAARAALEEAAQKAVATGQATEHDLKIATQLAYVLTGGDRPAGSMAEEEHFLELERAGLVALCHEPKSRERMRHILETGRPLRN